jgi:hypothetical protein
MEAKDRKKLIAKIKLNELKNYLNEALTETRNVLLKKTKMTQEQFELFLKKNEQKLKESISSMDTDSDNSESNEAEANLSTNLGGSICEEEDSDKKILCQKRKRSEDDSDKNTNAACKSFEEEKLEFLRHEQENSEGLFEIKEIELDEDKSGNFYNYTSSKDNGMICNNEMPLNDIENDINIDELSFDNFELSKNNYLKNIFEEYDSKNKLENDNFVNILEKKNFEVAFNTNFLKEE